MQMLMCVAPAPQSTMQIKSTFAGHFFEEQKRRAQTEGIQNNGV